MKLFEDLSNGFFSLFFPISFLQHTFVLSATSVLGSAGPFDSSKGLFQRAERNFTTVKQLKVPARFHLVQNDCGNYSRDQAEFHLVQNQDPYGTFSNSFDQHVLVVQSKIPALMNPFS
jgi:hypothetical protein